MAPLLPSRRDTTNEIRTLYHPLPSRQTIDISSMTINKKFTVCPTIVEMQSIHPLHPSHILTSLITATEMTERVYRASIDDIRRHRAHCHWFLISMIL